MNSKENKDYFAEWDQSKKEETKQECKNEYSGGPDECGEKDLNDQDYAFNHPSDTNGGLIGKN